MIVPKHRILQAYAVTYAPGKDNATRFDEVAKKLGVDTDTVANTVAESMVSV
ncbi:hypothetical protein [Undibacterium rugosum]|uniref:hypothetical protein n=1 Tax=Undibacterium rugosum TaxID=2762291 RepID=UPI001B833E3B|nr:hypothetical protein [Undibacterium rugosum]MBR7777398.1 hypothetical protein [Undibacterium rugosum]